jgi:hypothetical protein
MAYVVSSEVQRWTAMTCSNGECHCKADGTAKQWRGPAARAIHFGEKDVPLCCPKCGRMLDVLSAGTAR